VVADYLKAIAKAWQSFAGGASVALVSLLLLPFVPEWAQLFALVIAGAAVLAVPYSAWSSLASIVHGGDRQIEKATYMRLGVSGALLHGRAEAVTAHCDLRSQAAASDLERSAVEATRDEFMAEWKQDALAWLTEAESSLTAVSPQRASQFGVWATGLRRFDTPPHGELAPLVGMLFSWEDGVEDEEISLTPPEEEALRYFNRLQQAKDDAAD
jgi:hypothetical protein